MKVLALLLAALAGGAHAQCAAPDGMTGFEYMTGLSGQPDGDPYGYPNGYINYYLASNGYENGPAGCLAACTANAAGWECVGFMTYPTSADFNYCYFFQEGGATGWNDQGHTSAVGQNGWTTYRKCGNSPPPPPCAAGTSGSPGSCADCAAGQHQPSAGQESCTSCPAGQYQGSTGQQGCADCSAGQYQGSAGQAGCGVWCHDPPFSIKLSDISDREEFCPFSSIVDSLDSWGGMGTAGRGRTKHQPANPAAPDVRQAATTAQVRCGPLASPLMPFTASHFLELSRPFR